MTVRVYVSLGSNIDRETNLAAAIRALHRQYAPLVLSSVYRNAAQGFVGEDFYNMVVGFDTDHSLETIRTDLRAIEKQCGRSRIAEKFESRTLDIDVLLYGDLVSRAGPWDIPRREIECYAFVLGPLSEIAGDYRHPETGKTIARMWSEFDTRGQELVLVDMDFGL